MTRTEQLEALADVLQLAAEKAQKVASAVFEGTNREVALAKQIEGIAMEYRVMAAEAPRVVQMPHSKVANDGDATSRT